ncbi:MAG: hypothetical protein JWR48_3755 [Mycobacterium sp.]|nr:hypothetical protein [Mycobacterium sp.]
MVLVVPTNKLTDAFSVTPMTRIRSLFQWLFLLSAVAIALLLAAPAWAAYVIYVQGTNNFTPGTPNVPVSTIFNGSFSNQANFGADPLTVQNLSYPATFGLLNVLTYHGHGLPPTLNKSVAIGVAALDAQIKADQAENPSAKIYVIGYSEGAIVGTQEALALQGQDPGTYTNITFILAGNPERAAPSGGGVATQIPIPITIPGVATVGGGVLSAPTPTNGPTIIDVTNQGDPAANFDLAHPLAIVSGALKTFSMLLTGNPTGPHNYTNTVLTPAMVTSGTYVTPATPGYVVTTTGHLTDVFIPSTTPSPAPHLPVQLAQPVTRLRPVSSTVQSSAFTPKPIATQQVTKPVATQQVTKPVAMQQATKPTHTQQHLAGQDGK